MLNLSDRPFFGDIPLHDVTSEHSEDGLRQRLSYEIDQADWDDETREKLRMAEELAIEAHHGDDRGAHPYSTHFLRVTIRIISQNHLAVHNPDLLIAALLHDTVEDHADFYATVLPPTDDIPGHEHAIRVISDLFGARVGELALAVTNPERPAEITDTEEKYEFYREHVREILATNEEAGVIKLSDFIDNCAGLTHNEDPARAVRLARKYMPLIPDYYQFVTESTILAQERKPYLLAQLEKAENRCLDLIENAA